MLAAATPLPAEECSLDAAHGRAPARPVRARDDLIPFARSAIDGYAVQAGEVAGAAHVPLVISERGAVYAGDLPSTLAPGTAMAISTGTPLLIGADAIVPGEDVEVRGRAIEASEAPVAVLPGNPEGAFVAYVTLVRGVVRRLGGRTDVVPVPLRAIVEGSVHAKRDHDFSMFGELRHDGAQFVVRPLENQCSPLVRAAADANALIHVPPGEARFASGSAA